MPAPKCVIVATGGVVTAPPILGGGQISMSCDHHALLRHTGFWSLVHLFPSRSVCVCVCLCACVRVCACVCCSSSCTCRKAPSHRWSCLFFDCRVGLTRIFALSAFVVPVCHVHPTCVCCHRQGCCVGSSHHVCVDGNIPVTVCYRCAAYCCIVLLVPLCCVY